MYEFIRKILLFFFTLLMEFEASMKTLNFCLIPDTPVVCGWFQ